MKIVPNSRYLNTYFKKKEDFNKNGFVWKIINFSNNNYVIQFIGYENFTNEYSYSQIITEGTTQDISKEEVDKLFKTKFWIEL